MEYSAREALNDTDVSRVEIVIWSFIPTINACFSRPRPYLGQHNHKIEEQNNNQSTTTIRSAKLDKTLI